MSIFTLGKRSIKLFFDIDRKRPNHVYHRAKASGRRNMVLGSALASYGLISANSYASKLRSWLKTADAVSQKLLNADPEKTLSLQDEILSFQNTVSELTDLLANGVLSSLSFLLIGAILFIGGSNFYSNANLFRNKPEANRFDFSLMKKPITSLTIFSLALTYPLLALCTPSFNKSYLSILFSGTWLTVESLYWGLVFRGVRSHKIIKTIIWPLRYMEKKTAKSKVK